MFFSGVGSRNKFDKYLKRWRVRNFLRQPVGRMGHFRYDIGGDAGLTPQQHAILTAKQLNPFSFTLEKPLTLDENDTPVMITSEHEFHLRQILSAWLTLKLNLDVKNFQTRTQLSSDHLHGIMYFIPLSENDYIYMDTYQAANVDIDLTHLIGRGLISADPLAEKALKLHTLDRVIYIDGLYLYELDNPLPRTVLEPQLEIIQDEVQNLSENGHYVTSSTTYFTTKFWLGTEVANVWDFRFGPDRVIDLNYETKRFITHFAPGPSLGIWLEKTLLRIVSGQIPQVMLTGSWSNLTDLTNKQHRLHLATILAYRDVVAMNPCLYEAVADITVTPNLTICIPVFELADLQRFEEALMIQLPRLHLYKISKTKIPTAIAAGKFWIYDPDYKIPAEPFVSSTHLAGPAQFRMATAAEMGLYQFFAHTPVKIQLSGTVVLHGDFWDIDLGDMGQRHLFRIDTDLDKESQEQIRANLQQRWENGEFLTPWGKFMFAQHEIYSIFMTKPPVEVDVYFDNDGATLL